MQRIEIFIAKGTTGWWPLASKDARKVFPYMLLVFYTLYRLLWRKKTSECILKQVSLSKTKALSDPLQQSRTVVFFRQELKIIWHDYDE